MRLNSEWRYRHGARVSTSLHGTTRTMLRGPASQLSRVNRKRYARSELSILAQLRHGWLETFAGQTHCSLFR